MNFTLIVVLSLLMVTQSLEAFKIKRSIIDNLQNGLRMMGREDRNKITYSYKPRPSTGVSNKVADLVSLAFNKNNKNTPTNEKRQDAIMIGEDIPGDVSITPDSSLMSGFLKVLGFDGAKVGAFAMNSLIFIAQMLGQMLMPKAEEKEEKDEDEDNPQIREDVLIGDPFNWMLENEKVSSMLTDIKDKSLPEKIISTITEGNYTNGQADCVMMLVCKVKPFIWNMQNAVVDKLKSMVDTPKSRKDEPPNSLDNIAMFFEYLPSFEEYANNGEDCEATYHRCKLF